jgi:large subunit ribosomal protein L22
MPGPKTNERVGTRAVLRYFHMSASKARVVLDLIRGEDVITANEILSGTEREAADVISKLLASAVANAVNNDGLSADELFVAAAFADEGPTMKRFSPRARGRAGRIKKRSTHITIIVARMDEERLEQFRSRRNAQAAASRGRRVASSRRRADQQASLNRRETAAAARAEAEAAELEHQHDDEDVDVEVVTGEAGAPDETIDSSEDETVEVTDETASDDATEETDK